MCHKACRVHQTRAQLQWQGHTSSSSDCLIRAPARNTPHNRRAEGTSPVDQRSEHSSTQSSSRGGNRDVHKGVPGGSRWVSPAFSRDTSHQPFQPCCPCIAASSSKSLPNHCIVAPRSSSRFSPSTHCLHPLNCLAICAAPRLQSIGATKAIIIAHLIGFTREL